MNSGPVLLTWVAVNNDPYERDGQSGLAKLVDGAPVPGPTLTLLCDEDSPYAGRINDVVLLHRAPPGGANDREARAVTELSEALHRSPPRF
jgi:hypothetical protein